MRRRNGTRISIAIRMSGTQAIRSMAYIPGKKVPITSPMTLMQNRRRIEGTEGARRVNTMCTGAQKN